MMVYPGEARPPRSTSTESSAVKEPGACISFACPAEGIVVLRVRGRGDHHHGPALRHAAEMAAPSGRSPQFVLDLEDCSHMDSTFMGILASIALKQRRDLDCLMTVVNSGAHVRQQLELLGLKFILDIRGGARGASSVPGEPGAFRAVEPPPQERIDRIVMMIEAHQGLIDLDKGNEVKFKGVLRSLQESLERARGAS